MPCSPTGFDSIEIVLECWFIGLVSWSFLLLVLFCLFLIRQGFPRNINNVHVC